jgi:hypothetical protein
LVGELNGWSHSQKKYSSEILNHPVPKKRLNESISYHLLSPFFAVRYVARRRRASALQVAARPHLAAAAGEDATSRSTLCGGGC